jgi:hypothetical protein
VAAGLGGDDGDEGRDEQHRRRLEQVDESLCLAVVRVRRLGPVEHHRDREHHEDLDLDGEAQPVVLVAAVGPRRDVQAAEAEGLRRRRREKGWPRAAFLRRTRRGRSSRSRISK